MESAKGNLQVAQMGVKLAVGHAGGDPHPIRNVKWEMWNVECGMWNVEWEMWNGKCGMWNVECGMWNVECGLTL